MNWFGATELVTAAKSAVKEAQKAIDKALDIKEEVDSVEKIEVSGKLCCCTFFQVLLQSFHFFI